MRYFYLICGFVASFPSFSQAFLNGDFESHISDSCAVNLTNHEFDSLVPNIYGFGKEPELDILADGCDVTPVSGSWCLGVAHLADFEGGDAVSLELSEPLAEGSQYELSFWIYHNTKYEFVFGESLDSIAIGLSIENRRLGAPLLVTIPETENLWQEYQIEFTADSAYSYATVTIRNDFKSGTWMQVDDFKIRPLNTAVYDAPAKESMVQVFPNPAGTTLSVEVGKGTFFDEIRIVSLQAQEIVIAMEFMNKIDVRDLPSGVYVLELIGDSQYITKKFTKL